MSICIDKYVDLLSRYGIYGENGYYIDPHIIRRMVVDETELPMSFEEIEKFVNDCERSIIKESPAERKNIEKSCKPLLQCKTFFGILGEIAKIKEGTISEEEWTHLVDLNIHINEYGDIYVADAVFLSDAISNNVKDLYSKVTKDNDINPYPTVEKENPNIKNGVLIKGLGYSIK